jgi:HlyD family secretion protein
VTGLSDGLDIEIRKGLTANDEVRGPQVVADDNKEE